MESNEFLPVEEFEENSNAISDQFLEIINELNNGLEDFTANPPSNVKYIYNPTIYARNNFKQYVERYCNTKKQIMYLGINPGPWGMSQTGVPFGDKEAVQNWLQINGEVEKPANECEKRRVKGFNCHRTEISGKRFWGFFKELCQTPEKFHESSFLYNYLPQQWIKESGANITPGDLKKNEVEGCYEVCDRALYKIIKLYSVKVIIAIGGFSEKRAKKVIKSYFPSENIKIVLLQHPSPRTVHSDADWYKKAKDILETNDLIKYYMQN